MKKILDLFYLLALVIVVGVICYSIQASKSKNVGFAQGDWNYIQGGSRLTTSTSSSLPVKVLSADGNRQYAIFTNKSDTALYLYVTSSAMTIAQATSSITALDGIYLAANGGTYELLPSKMITGEFWVSSTAASKAINVYYK